MYEIAVCDDCEVEREWLIKQIIDSRVNQESKNFRIHEYYSDNELLNTEQDVHFAAVFLGTGIETAKKLRKRDPNFILVLCTKSTAIPAYYFEARPDCCISKSMPEALVSEYMEDILKLAKVNGKIPFLAGSVNKKQIIIKPEHITYIEKYKRSIRIHLSEKACYLYGLEACENGEYPDIRSQKPLHEIYEKLKRYGFGCPHDSYIINFQYLRMCTSKELQLEESNESFPIARSKSKEFHSRKDNFISKYM